MVHLFSSQKTNVLSNPFWYFVLFPSVFYCYFDFSKQHFTKDNNEKKSHGRRNETTLYLLLKTCWKFPNKREHQTSTSLRASSLFWGSREKSRDSSTRKETRVRGAGWEARSLSSRLNFNSCLARCSFSWQFRSIVEPWRFCGLQALLVTDTIFSLPFWPRNVWNSSNRSLKQIGNSGK